MASKTSAKSGGTTGKGRRPSGKPVPIKQPKPWGTIALGTVVAVFAVGVIGGTFWFAQKESAPWAEKAAAISGITNYRESDPAMIKDREHKSGVLKFKTSPPVAGTHNGTWQNCSGDVYDAPIANEHAVHSLEHGAVWITYKKGLKSEQVKKLAERVKGKDQMLMSPYEGLDKNISLQAWGYQLKVDDADDERIDAFIKALRKNATMEPGAACSGGVTATGTTPQPDPPTGDAPAN
jgi:hypothetical protein